MDSLTNSYLALKSRKLAIEYISLSTASIALPLPYKCAAQKCTLFEQRSKLITVDDAKTIASVIGGAELDIVTVCCMGYLRNIVCTGLNKFKSS